MAGAGKAGRISPVAFMASLAAPLPQAVALVGDSGYEKKRLVHAILERPGEQAAVSVFECEQSSPSTEDLQRLSNDLLSVPLFGGRRAIVVIRRGEDFLKKGRSLLLRFLAQKQRNAVVLVLGSLEKDSELEGALAARGVIVACDKPGRRFGSNDQAMLEWLMQETERRGLPLEPGALPLLLDLVGEEQERLAEELNKLELAAGPSKKITVALVQSLATPAAMKSVDELLRPILRGRTQEALRVLEVILREGLLHWSGRSIRGEESVPVPLLYWLHDRIRKIAATHEARQVGEKAAREAMGIRSDPQWRMLQSEAKLLSHARARAALIALYRAEDMLKSAASGRTVLTDLVVRLSAGAEQAAAAARR